MKYNTLDKVKKIVLIILLLTLMAIFVILLVISKSSSTIDSINEFINNDVKVLYVSDKKNYSNYPLKIFKEYDIDYLYVNSSNLSAFERNKLSKIVNNNSLKNIIVIFNDNKVQDAIISYSTEDQLNKFLQKNKILPENLSDTKGIIEQAEKYLNTDFSLLYIPYIYENEIYDQSKILNELASEYQMQYKEIDAYLLSYHQKQKLNSILQISNVEDQIVILIKDKKIVGSIRGKNDKNQYVKDLYNLNIINSNDKQIKQIDYTTFSSLINSNLKNIIFIEKDNCKYCDDVKKTLNKLILDYDIEVKAINIKSFDSEIANKVSNDLVKLKYEDGFTAPFIMIVESGNLLDYIIGVSTEEYIIDLFNEYGIIK